MDLITTDFETYYDQEYSLSKLTTEEYIRDPRFEVIGVAVKVNGEPTEWASGTHAQLRNYLREFDWENSAILAQNTAFDGAILNWVFGITAKVYLDTMSMAKALHGPEARSSLAYLAELYGIGQKGTEVVNAKGKRRLDFTEAELSAYGDYCINDVELTLQLFNIFAKHFPKDELRVIDRTLRMFIEPVLQLDRARLAEHLRAVRAEKAAILDTVALSRTELMSNPKFAAALEELGVTPPKKISPSTGEPTYAFAKSDPEFIALLEHEDPAVQALVSARIGTKSTIEETRTQRFLDISHRGPLPIPLYYYGAHTGRWSGADSLNLQNLPSRKGKHANALKRCILPPACHKLVEADLSQIEARVLAWLSGQDDLVEAFRNNEPVYEGMAAKIYSRPVDLVTKQERALGKAAVLGAGYGMGAVRFREQVKSESGIDISEDMSQHTIRTYRETYPQVPRLWRQMGHVLSCMVNGEMAEVDPLGLLKMVPGEPALLLPSGLKLQYPELRAREVNGRPEYTYRTRRSYVRIYGGKVVENACQAIARCIMAAQILRISKRYPVLLTVHDSVVITAPEAEADDAARYVYECMQWGPAWAEGLPLVGEVSIGDNYGDTTKWQP